MGMLSRNEISNYIQYTSSNYISNKPYYLLAQKSYLEVKERN